MMIDSKRQQACITNWRRYARLSLDACGAAGKSESEERPNVR